MNNLNASRELMNLSSEMLDPLAFAEYIEDYYKNSKEYGIDEDSDYYIAICDSYYGILGLKSFGKWTAAAVKISHTYKEYVQLWKS